MVHITIGTDYTYIYGDLHSIGNLFSELCNYRTSFIPHQNYRKEAGKCITLYCQLFGNIDFSQFKVRSNLHISVLCSICNIRLERYYEGNNL